MQKILLALITLISFKSFNMETIGSLKLYHSDQVGFSVQEENSPLVAIHNYDVDPILRGKNSALIKAFQENGGRFSLNKLDNGEFVLKAHVPGLGGGPITGVCAYWGTKAAGWGAFAAAVIATHGEMLVHTMEYAHMIEAAATTAGVIGTAAPTP